MQGNGSARGRKSRSSPIRGIYRAKHPFSGQVMILKAPICRKLHPAYAIDRNPFTGRIPASGYRLSIIEPSKSKGTRFQEGHREPRRQCLWSGTRFRGRSGIGGASTLRHRHPFSGSHPMAGLPKALGPERASRSDMLLPQTGTLRSGGKAEGTRLQEKVVSVRSGADES